MSAETILTRGAAWAEAVKAACNRRGLHLTPSRERVLAVLSDAAHPLGAYAILEALTKREARPVAPPTVYRALEFFQENGFLHKIESKNLYAPCEHVGHAHEGVLLLCDSCGRSEEVEDESVANQVQATAARAGFLARRQMIEVQGVCRDCAAKAA